MGRNGRAMIYLSIDIEASGPFPGLFSMVSLGAVPVLRREKTWTLDEDHSFYVEIQPLEGAGEDPEAMAIHGLTVPHLMESGLPPLEAMLDFEAWLKARGSRCVPAAWPSSFDHPYVGWYLQRFLGRNPLGWSAFDIPSYAMGLLRCHRLNLRSALHKAGLTAPANPKPHHALYDAIEQGHLLANLLNHAGHPAR